jgi:hypothetical protein
MILKITDGVVTVDFAGSNDYSVSSWSPAVAARRRGQLAGQGPYSNVVESMVISIADPVLTNLAKLSQLMAQAEAWAEGEQVAPVQIHYKPHSSSANTLMAAILGPARPGEPMIVPPRNFGISPVTKMLDGVTLRFLRRGAWLGASNNQVSSAATIPSVRTVTFSGAAAVAASPVDANLILAGAANVGNDLPDSFSVFASDSNRIGLFEAEDMTATGFTSVADAANGASGGNVLRYTPSGTAITQTGQKVVTSVIDQSSRRIAFLANFRNNSGTTSFKVRVAASAGTDPDGWTPWVTIGPDISAPVWINLGTLAFRKNLFAIRLQVQASAASGTLDIDTVVLVAMDDSTSRIISRHKLAKGSVAATTTMNVLYEHRALSEIAPAAFYRRGALATGVFYESYGGDPYIVTTGTKLAALFLACGNQTTPSRWRLQDIGGTAVTVQLDATRYTAHLAPI